MPSTERPEPSPRRRPHREIKIMPPTFVPMTHEQREEAVRALAALLRPVIKNRAAGHNVDEIGEAQGNNATHQTQRSDQPDADS